MNNLIGKIDKKGKVLIAGTAGFIGARVAEALCTLGVSVIGLDNFASGKTKRLKRLRHNDNFELVEADILKEFPSGLRRERITHIIDATDVFPHIGRTEMTLKGLLGGSFGLKNLLDLANRLRAIVVYTSSVDIYQGLASHENLQNYFDGPELTTYYGFLEAKRYGEVLCREYADKFDLDIRIARLPEVYGPGMDLKSSSLLARSIRLVLEGKDLILDEEGSREHQLIYGDDVVFGLVKLLFAKEDKAGKGIFYFTNPEKVSTLSIAYTLRELLTNQQIKVEFFPKHQKVGFPPPHKIDISRTQKLLKWEPKIDLTPGLERTLKWAKIAKEKASQKASLSISEKKESPPSSTKSPVVEEALEIKEPEPVAQEVETGKKKDLRERSRERPNGKGWLSLKLDREPQIIKGIEQKTRGFRWPRVGLRNTIIGLSIIIFLGMVPLMITAGLLIRSFFAFKSFDFPRANVLANQAVGFFGVYQVPSRVIGLGNYQEATNNSLESVALLAQVLEDSERVAQPLVPTLNKIVSSWGQETILVKPEDKEELIKNIQEAVSIIPNAETDFALLEQKINSADERYLPRFIQSELIELKELVWLFSPVIPRIKEVIEKSDILLGYERPQRYLIILQNNAEIRPTGGFIGSYVAFDLDQGSITQFKVDDIYNPDGLLTKHEDPSLPDPMKKYLGVDFVGLRDSNWWPDFSVSMENFVKLYERATNEKIDGVIGLNLSLVQRLLEITGPVSLDVYNETINSENIFERAQFHSEVGFEPGSTQKKDFLANLSVALLNQLFANQANFKTGLAKLLVSGLASRDILVYATDSDLQRSLRFMQLAGRLTPSDKDFVYIVDSNVGGNKANYWVKRKSGYAVDVDREGRLTGNLKITWQHQGTSTTWPGGDYKNYVRVYLPKEIQNIQVEPGLTDQIIYEEYGKKVVAGLVEVPVSSEASVLIKYSLPDKLTFSKTDEYSLVWQNQPGMKEEVDFRLNLPIFLKTQANVLWKRTLDHPVLYRAIVAGAEAIK